MPQPERREEANLPHHTATCACGAVEIAFDAAPIAVVSCCCDDCQAAGEILEALPGAPRYREACGGTPVVLFPRTALKLVRGGDRLVPYRLKDTSRTRRMVAACCNSALSIGFDRGPFWVSVLRARMDEAVAEPRWRIQTRFLAAPPPDNLKNHPRYPQALVWRIALAGVLAQLPRR